MYGDLETLDRLVALWTVFSSKAPMVLVQSYSSTVPIHKPNEPILQGSWNVKVANLARRKVWGTAFDMLSARWSLSICKSD